MQDPLSGMERRSSLQNAGNAISVRGGVKVFLPEKHRTRELSMMKNQKRQKKRFEHWQMVAIYLLVYDIVVIAASFFGALWFRFDCRFQQIPQEYFAHYMKFLPVQVGHIYGIFIF